MPSITALQQELGRFGFTVTVLVLLTLGLVIVASLRRRGAGRIAGLGARIGLGIVVAGVLSLTLVGWIHPSEGERILILDPVEGAWGWDSIAWRPVFDNVVLFVPVGGIAAAVWCRRTGLLVWSGCVAFSVAIEGFQYLIPTGRVANSADVIANGSGALLGLGIAVWTGARSGPRPSGGRHPRSRPTGTRQVDTHV